MNFTFESRDDNTEKLLSVAFYEGFYYINSFMKDSFPIFK